MLRLYLFFIIILSAIMPIKPSNAEVLSHSDNGFALKYEIIVNARPNIAYRKFGQIQNWWSSSHTWTQDAKNLRLELRNQGCFCENLGNGGMATHLQIIYLKPNDEIRLEGALGPMQQTAVLNRMSVKFTAFENKTKINVIFSAAGYANGGIENWAEGVDAVLAEQFNSLKNYIDTN